MHKKTFLLLFSVLLLLTGCNETDLPAEHTSTDNKKLSSDISSEPTDSSIAVSTKDNAMPEDGNTPQDSTVKNANATENPEETLNNILNELQELDELINGTE